LPKARRDRLEGTTDGRSPAEIRVGPFELVVWACVMLALVMWWTH
jgi:hypothetical protein